MRSIDAIIVHCSATKEGCDFTVADIDRWHKERKYRCIGYHFVIYRDGSVHAGRPVEEVGAHVKGHNAHSIGICYIGGLDAKGHPKDTRTPQQKAAMYTLIQRLKAQFPKAIVYGHRNFNLHKACPCFDAMKEYENIHPI